MGLLRRVAVFLLALSAFAAAPDTAAAEGGGGVDLDRTAAVNGMTRDELEHVLEDRAVRIGAGDRLYYVEQAFHAETEAATTDVTAAAVVPYDQTFLLHSRPGSSRTIYLDFNGHQISGTAWNSGGLPSSYWAEPYSIDGLSSFSTVELDAIQSIWQRVAEDFAPLDVDVTTEEPPADAITRSGTSDLVYGTRALITNMPEYSSTCSCGGVAYVGVFDEPTSHAFYQPALVFPHMLGYSTKAVAEATSHEVGHNLGLLHDGTSTVGYYRGHGAWAPIMGVGDERPVVQWSRGEYSGANNREDDFAVMAANGALLAADDHGNLPGSATLVAGPSVAAAGVITTDADVDVFAVDAGAGVASFTVTPAAASPNLDVGIQLLSSAGAVVTSADPPSLYVSDDTAVGLDATLSATLAGGRYYLAVTGVGSGSASTGYTGYGSVGRYTVAGTVPAGVVVSPAPQVSIADVSVTEGNTGTTTATFTVSLSAAATSDVTVTAATADGSALAPGDYAGATSAIVIPAGQTAASFAVAVVGDAVVEPDESFAVSLSNSVGATIGDGSATGRIVNDDVAGRTISVGDVSVTEGNSGTRYAAFTLRLSSASSSSVSVRLATANGTAAAPSDYTAVSSSTVSFSAGTTTRTFSVAVRGDLTVEPNETFVLNLASPVGASIGDGRGVGTIVNDDGTTTGRTISVGDVSVTEGNSGTRYATFTLRLSSASSSSVSVRVTTANGTALAPADYTAVSGSTVSFSAGTTTRTFSVAVRGDVTVEPNETFVLNLSSPLGASIGDGQGVATIVNDDALLYRW